MNKPALRVRDLGVTAGTGEDRRVLLEGLNLSLERGSSAGLVGSSGAGKSTLGLALMRLLPEGLALDPRSQVELDGVDLLALRDGEMRERRGRRIAMVFQEPLQALNPSMAVGDQLAESLIVHGISLGREAEERAVEMLGKVGIAGARAAARRYPHEFSGGMRQRLLIASALLLGPDVLVADEPTTALDPTVQAQVLDLIDALRAETGTALLLISHDLDIVGERCERLLVLDGGRVVEDGPACEVLASPRAPATRTLSAARAKLATAVPAAAPAGDDGTPLLTVRELSVRYALDRRRGDFQLPGAGARAPERAVVHAVDSVSFSIARGESLGLVGESGCGKTSLAHAVLRLVPASGGGIHFDGVDLLASRGEALRRLRRRVQLVPQDAGASLTPQMTIGALVAEGLEVHGIATGKDARRRAAALLEEMGLPARVASVRPRELSAGERQRAAIARALATGPELLVCDEPVASVDAPTRMLLLDMLDRLRIERGLSLLFISHDLGAVSRITSRVAVMYLGRIVELAPTAHLMAQPRMPYTQALLSAVPTGDPAAVSRRVVLRGELPSAVNPPAGCPFHPRCPHPLKDAQCAEGRPPLTERDSGHLAACWKQ